MLKDILDSIVSKFTEKEVENVYSAFDAYPVEKKGELFTVVGIGAFETAPPIYSQFTVYLPFKTEIEVNTTAKRDMSMVELYNYYCNNIDTSSYRVNWGASDSSPIIDAASDTLIWPSENGFIYTFKLNTVYEKGSSSISISVEPYNFKYIFNDSHKGATVGVESSIAVYNGYGYFCDNDWNLICLDLNTLQMVWQFKLGDDTDVSPVIEEENGIPYLYICTEVDGQGGVVGEYSGAAYTYKINGLTGEVIWQTSQPCYTNNGETSETDNTGGCLGNPIVGKKGISNLVIFTYSRTQSLIDGNRLVAYDKLTGNTVWTYEMNKYSYSSPVDVYDKEGNGYILIGDSYGQIHLVDAQTGERITHILVNSDVTGQAFFEASAAVYEDTLVIGSVTGSIYAVKIGHVEEQ